MWILQRWRITHSTERLGELPQLRRVLPAQLPEAIDRLVDKGEMEPDVALPVRLNSPSCPNGKRNQAADTRGYAFLMLAEGAIHGILRSAEVRAAQTCQEAPEGADPSG
jgi:hypothetical protein